MKKNVFIIENDQDVRNIIAYILEQEGCNVHSVPYFDNPNEISAANPDVILVDEFIQEEPGHRLCHRIKQLKDLEHVPVIIMSTANDIERIAAECNADGYIAKPFDIYNLTEKVLHAMGAVPIQR